MELREQHNQKHKKTEIKWVHILIIKVKEEIIGKWKITTVDEIYRTFCVSRTIQSQTKNNYPGWPIEVLHSLDLHCDKEIKSNQIEEDKLKVKLKQFRPRRNVVEDIKVLEINLNGETKRGICYHPTKLME